MFELSDDAGIVEKTPAGKLLASSTIAQLIGHRRTLWRCAAWRLRRPLSQVAFPHPASSALRSIASSPPRQAIVHLEGTQSRQSLADKATWR
jgi:hypothetical protein